MPEKFELIRRWPWLQRYAWCIDITLSVAAPIIALLHYQDGRVQHAIFWIIFAIWAERGATVRYAVRLYIDLIADRDLSRNRRKGQGDGQAS